MPVRADQGSLADLKRLFEDAIAMTALKRLGHPDDIASAVAKLAGPDAAWITGQNIAADGGFMP